MASYFLLRKEYADANVYLHSIAQYLSSNDNFNWNYGISLAAAGNYAEAEEVLLRVRSDALTSHLTLCSWLARCYIYNDKNPGHAWELYLKMESTSDAYKLLKLIANDYYKVRQAAQNRRHGDDHWLTCLSTNHLGEELLLRGEGVRCA